MGGAQPGAPTNGFASARRGGRGRRQRHAMPRQCVRACRFRRFRWQAARSKPLGSSGPGWPLGLASAAAASLAFFSAHLGRQRAANARELDSISRQVQQEDVVLRLSLVLPG